MLGNITNNRSFTHLNTLEREPVHVIREVVAEYVNQVLLFFGEKDSVVLLRLAEKAFRPGRFPFPFMHIDTEHNHNFPEVIEFRDRRAKEVGERLIVRSMEYSIKKNRVILRSEH
jgi:sulfate adenylyltransferase subunit 2